MAARVREGTSWIDAVDLVSDLTDELSNHPPLRRYDRLRLRRRLKSVMDRLSRLDRGLTLQPTEPVVAVLFDVAVILVAEASAVRANLNPSPD